MDLLAGDGFCCCDDVGVLLLLLLSEGWVVCDGGCWSAVSRVEAVEVWTVVVVDILVCGELRSVKLAELRLESLNRWKREW